MSMSRRDLLHWVHLSSAELVPGAFYLCSCRTSSRPIQTTGSTSPGRLERCPRTACPTPSSPRQALAALDQPLGSTVCCVPCAIYWSGRPLRQYLAAASAHGSPFDTPQDPRHALSMDVLHRWTGQTPPPQPTPPTTCFSLTSTPRTSEACLVSAGCSGVQVRAASWCIVELADALGGTRRLPR